MEGQGKELSSLKRDLELSESERSVKLKDLEKQMKAVKLEKEDLGRDLTEVQEKLKLQSKQAMTEYAEVTDKYVILKSNIHNTHAHLEVFNYS
jgi:chromosome segregation and condensation protein ScpB